MGQSIFKAYNIRGAYPTELNESMFFRIGRGLADIFDGRVLVGRDGRLSSPDLYAALIAGMLSAGKKTLIIEAIGIMTTPMQTFLVHQFKFTGSVMVTASHNPAGDNGLKILNSQGRDVLMSEVVGAYQRYEQLLVPRQLPAVYEVDSTPHFDAYVSFLKSQARIRRRVRVVFDCSNGVVASVVSRLQTAFPDVDFILLNEQIDGRFSAHGPNPKEVGATEQAQRAVAEERADLGVVFDGDADRAVFIDNQGRRMSAEAVTICIAQLFAGPIVVEHTLGYTVRAFAQQAKRELVETKVGSSYIHTAMHESGAEFGAESSFHFYFKSFFGNDDGLMAFLMMLNVVSGSERSLSEFVDALPQTIRMDELNFSFSSQEQIAELLETLFITYGSRASNTTQIDGIKCEFTDPNWWFSVRPSANEPLIRFNLEALDSAVFEAKKTEILSIIRRFK